MKYVTEQSSNPFSNTARSYNCRIIEKMRSRPLQAMQSALGSMALLRFHVLVLLFTHSLICSFVFTNTTPDAFANAPTQSLEILKLVKVAESEVSFIGTRFTTSHAPHGMAVRDEFVIHHPPKVHAVRALSVVGGLDSLGFRDIERSRIRNGRRRHLGAGDRHSDRRQPLPPRKRISTLSQEEIELLAQNYRFDSSLGDVVADQETYVIKISPKFEGRPTKVLYISRDNGMILRTEDFDPAGNLRSLSVYTQIDFNRDKVKRTLAELKKKEKIPFEDQSRRSGLIEGAEAEKVLDDRIVKPTYLPRGFQLLDTRYIKHRSGAVFLRYTDGLVTFSLFERKIRRLFHFPGRPHRRKNQDRAGTFVPRHDVSIHLMKQHQAHILEWAYSGVDFTLIGELDSSELIKVAESVILAAKKLQKWR